MVPLSHESYGRMYQPASQLLYELAILASSSGAVGKAQFVESALRELSVSLCRGNHRIVAAYAAQCAPEWLVLYAWCYIVLLHSM